MMQTQKQRLNYFMKLFLKTLGRMEARQEPKRKGAGNEYRGTKSRRLREK